MVKKNVFNAIALIAGTAIGAGFLGMPYLIAKSGFFVGLMYLFLIGLFVLFVQLSLGEIVLRTKGNHHLAGYAKKYLGKKSRNFMFLITLFYILSALVAYLIAQGQSLSYIIFGNSSHAFWISILFWVLMASLSYIGLRALKKFGKVGFFVIIGFVLLIAIFFSVSVSLENLIYFNPENIFLPFGIILFSFLSFSSIPSAERLILGKEKLLKKAIFFGVLIPFLIYSVFSFIMVGNFGDKLPEVATLALGRGFALLGVFAIFTSFLSLSISLRDMIRFDFKVKRFKAWLICAISPLILYLFIYFFNIASFVQILSVAGVVAGGLTGIIVLMINVKAKEKGKRIPEYNTPLNKKSVAVLSFVFIFGMMMQLFGEKINSSLSFITGSVIGPRTLSIISGSFFALIFIILMGLFIVFLKRNGPFPRPKR